jgi:mono/diheme cytochrome c family protein
MTLGRRSVLVGALVLVSLLGVLVLPGDSQHPPSSGRPPAPGAGGSAGHGTPKGWKFRWPKGDPTQGREVFAKLECYSCHEVQGEKFPAPTPESKVGPELSQMGPLHEAEYFVEAIINPSAVIEKGKGYQAADGSSRMPSFNDSMTVQEAIDLVAFLRALKPAPGKPAGHRTH